MLQIEELLSKSVEELEAMTYAEKEAALKHYFAVTRPDQAKKFTEHNNHVHTAPRDNLKIERAKAIAQSLGVDLGFDN